MCVFFHPSVISDINGKTKDITIDVYDYEKTEKGEIMDKNSLCYVK